MIFRRKPAAAEAAPEQPAADALDELEADRPRGPWDRSETTVDEGDGSYVDLGGLVVKGAAGLELRLQVDEQTSAVSAVMLAGAQSGLELRGFAAPRRSGIWEDVRRDIAAEAAKRGGTATEVDGEFGTELKVVVPITLADGRGATQATRIVGVDGPRWLLRGTFLGQSAQEPDPGGVVEQAFRDVIVVRGDGPMAPREMLEMQMPDQAVESVEAEESKETGPDDL